jgi:folate-binding protein YgfZ
MMLFRDGYRQCFAFSMPRPPRFFASNTAFLAGAVSDGRDHSIEANLESAPDYEKGCYIGQEVISRIKMSGQTNKRLCGLSRCTMRRFCQE